MLQGLSSSVAAAGGQAPRLREPRSGSWGQEWELGPVGAGARTPCLAQSPSVGAAVCSTEIGPSCCATKSAGD